MRSKVMPGAAPTRVRLAECATGPVPVASGVASLLRAFPAPGADESQVVSWLSRKAALLEAISGAAADPGLADDARVAAAAARQALAAMPAVPVVPADAVDVSGGVS